jgi:LPXTG-motif cell wall-anchored protein
MSFTTNRFCEEETTLMEYGVNFHDKLFANIANEGWNATKTFNIKNLKFVTIPGFTFDFSLANIVASAANNGKDKANEFTKPISWNVEKYNNGPAPVWPLIPDTKAEKETLAAGGTVTRPDAPTPKTTNFKAEVIGVKAVKNGDKTDVVISFSEPLDKGQFGFGLNIAEKWETIWNEEGTQVTLSVSNSDVNVNASAELIIFRLMDKAGNLIGGPIKKSFELPEKIAPVTEVIKAGTAGENSWYLSDARITLSATDNDGGIGVKNTLYSFDGVEWHNYSEPIDIKTEGITTLKYYSVDRYGNKGEIQELKIQIDKTAPEITIDQPVDGGQYSVGQQVTASWNVKDALSGVQSSLGSIAVPNGGSLDTSKPGEYTFTVIAKDTAGNEQTKTVSYTVFVASNSDPENDDTNTGSNGGSNSDSNLPKTGSILDMEMVILAGFLMLIMGLVVIKRKKKLD